MTSRNLTLFERGEAESPQPEQSYEDDYGSLSLDVVVACHNEESIVRRQVQDMLTLPEMHHLIVVDDGSTDGSLQVLRGIAEVNPKMLVIPSSHGGKAAALNLGLPHVDTSLVFFTDMDTRIVPGKITSLAEELEKNRYDVVGGYLASDFSNANYLVKAYGSVRAFSTCFIRPLLEKIGGAPPVLSGSGMLCRHEVFQKTRFSTRTSVEDLDICWTLVRQGYRIHQASVLLGYTQEPRSLGEFLHRSGRWFSGFIQCIMLDTSLVRTRFFWGSVVPILLASLVISSWVEVSLMLIVFGQLQASVVWTITNIMMLIIASIYGARIEKRRLSIHFIFCPILSVVGRLAWIRWGIPAFFHRTPRKWVKASRY